MNILKVPKLSDSCVVKTSLKKIIREIVSVKHKKKVKNKNGDVEGEVIIRTLEEINNIVNNSNKVVIQTYFFLKSWILKKYEKVEPIPKITDEVIRLIFKLLTITKVSKKITDPYHLELYADMEDFYNERYVQIMQQPKVECSNYAQVFHYISTDIVTNIENNIKMHFFDYVKCFVNGMCCIDYNDNLTKEQNRTIQKELKKELYKVKKDILFKTKKSKAKYHDFIDFVINDVLQMQDVAVNKLWKDLPTNPQKYLSSMIFMNRILENKGRKTFNVLPLRTSCIPKYIPIDTTVIIQLLMKKVFGSSDCLKNRIEKADAIWNLFFDLEDKVFKRNKYKFAHFIYTDGYAVSILFETDNWEQNRINKQANINKKKLINKEARKGKSKEWIDKHKEEEKKNKLLKEEEFEKRQMEAKEKQKEAYNKLSKEDKEKLKQEKLEKLDTEEKKIAAQDEFPYLQDLTPDQINNLKQSKLVYIDPGKIRYYTMIDDDDNVLKYSNAEYIKRTKRKEYNDKLKRLRVSEGITVLENFLSNFNSKSCNFEKFTDYVSNKNNINNALLEAYKNMTFRKMRWYSYIMKQREIERLTNLIGKTYGKNCKLIMGDWCQSKQMKNFVPTPMIGLKRKLRKKFEIINLDEYNTSKLGYITEMETQNIRLPIKVPIKDENNKIMRDRNGKILTELLRKKIHSILVYPIYYGRMGCINRDINSVKNMRKIVNHWFDTGVRLENYCKKKKKIIDDESLAKPKVANHKREIAARSKRILRAQLKSSDTNSG